MEVKKKIRLRRAWRQPRDPVVQEQISAVSRRLEEAIREEYGHGRDEKGMWQEFCRASGMSTRTLFGYRAEDRLPYGEQTIQIGRGLPGWLDYIFNGTPRSEFQQLQALFAKLPDEHRQTVLALMRILASGNPDLIELLCLQIHLIHGKIGSAESLARAVTLVRQAQQAGSRMRKKSPE